MLVVLDVVVVVVVVVPGHGPGWQFICTSTTSPLFITTPLICGNGFVVK